MAPLPQKAKTSETTKTSGENGAAVLDVLDFARNAATPIPQLQCEHCHRGGDVIPFAYDSVEASLHRECMDAWRAAYDALDIRNQPFYRPAP